MNNKNSLLENSLYKKSYNGTYILVRESLSGGKIKKSDLKEIVREYEKSAGVSSKDIDITINFEELGELNISKLQEDIDNPEVNYSKKDNILRVTANNIDLFYICGISNEKLSCYPEDLLVTTDKNVLIHKNFNVEDNIGYRTLALKTDNNIYIVKTNKNLSDDLISNILKQFNIDYSKLKLKEVQKVVPK